MTRMYIPFDPPTVRGTPCATCTGSGTVDQFETPTDQGPTLVIDAFCSTCGGCGSADHVGCDPQLHARVHVDDDGPAAFDDEQDDENDEPACPSCHGFGWWPCQSFRGDGANAEMVVLRMPCGCVESRALAV